MRARAEARGVLAIVSVGMTTAVGRTARASFAAIRAKISNFTETRFFDAEGRWIVAGQVTGIPQRTGVDRLIDLASSAVADCLAGAPPGLGPIPLLLCVSEKQRVGRPLGLDQQLFDGLAAMLEVDLGSSGILPHGKLGIAFALAEARSLVESGRHPAALIVGVDCLLDAKYLSAIDHAGRLAREGSPDGFVPGEGASAVLVSRFQPELPASAVIVGLETAREAATLDSDEPMMAEGLSSVIARTMAALPRSAKLAGYRVIDASGEQYFMKEAALAAARALRRPDAPAELWHPADCYGEIGAAAGPGVIALAAHLAAREEGMATAALCHFSGDDAWRASALVCSIGGRNVE